MRCSPFFIPLSLPLCSLCKFVGMSGFLCLLNILISWHADLSLISQPLCLLPLSSLRLSNLGESVSLSPSHSSSLPPLSPTFSHAHLSAFPMHHLELFCPSLLQFFSLLILEDLPSSLATCRNCPDSHFVTVQGLFVSWQGELLTLQRSVAGSL